MELPVGSHVGPYEIEAAIGAGGMGEVYRARDPRLGRDVAIKVLPAAWSTDAERLQRFEQDAALAGISALPTTPPNTQAGMVLGTMGYMSPEQVRGVTADHRADVFAFGVVLYEMLAGRRAFARETGVETMTAILREDPPDMPLMERHVPPALERLVDRCLEKDPAARFQSAGDVGYALEALSTHSDSDRLLASAAATPTPSRIRTAAPWAAAGLLFLSTAALATLYFAPPPPGAVVTFQVPPPGGGFFPGANNTPRMAISPDGRYLAFTVTLQNGAPEQLWIRRLDSVEARAIPNTEAPPGSEPVQQPFWSPDSRFVAFFAEEKLRRVEIASGNVQTIATVAGNNYGGSWHPDGTVLFGSSLTMGLWRVSATGGSPEQVTILDASANEQAHLWPQFLPDGRHFLYYSFGSPDGRKVYVAAVDSTERREVLASDHMAYFAPPDHLFFARDGALMVQRFDTKTLELDGEPVHVADGVQGSFTNGRLGVSVSASGMLVYRQQTSGIAADSELVWLDRSGKPLGTVWEPSAYRGIELSPDNRRVAVHREDREGGGDVWIVDLERGSTTRFTLDGTHSMSPVWSPDGRRLFFSRHISARWRMYEKDSAGVGAERLLLETGDNSRVLTPLGLSPDGLTMIYRVVSANTLGDYSVMTLLDRKTSPYLHVPFHQLTGQLSPDGRWIAYTSAESGRNEIFVESFPASGTKYAVSTAGGTQPRWRRDGRELFYVAAQPPGAPQPVMAVEVQPLDGGLRFGIPTRLFDSYSTTGRAHTGQTYHYAVAADGKRFLVSRLLGAGNTSLVQTPLTVVVNWPSLLNAR